MLATMTKPAKKAPVTKPLPLTLSPEEHAAFLQDECLEISLEISWLPTSRKVADVNATVMANSVDADSKALTIGKRLFASAHPAVKAANACKTAIYALRDKMTIPVASISRATKTAEEQKKVLFKEPGTRLIMIKLVDEFTERLQELTEELYTAVEGMQDVLEEIKDSDRKRLGSTYREDDYPKSVVDLVEVRGPHFRKMDVSVDLEKLAPKTCDLVRRQMEARISGTIELACDDFAGALLSTVKTVARQLGTVVKINPPVGHALRAYDKCPIVEKMTHADDPEIPDGHVQINVRFKLSEVQKADWADDRDKEGKPTDNPPVSMTTWLGPFSPKEYQALNPIATTEKNKLHESSLDNLMAKLETFGHIQEMLGDSAAPIGAAVDKVKAMVSQAQSSGDMVKEMRNSNFVRNQMEKALSAVASELQVVAVGTGRKRSFEKPVE